MSKLIMDVTIPIANEHWFTQNSRGNWRAKKQRTDVVRAAAYWLAVRARNRLGPMPRPLYAHAHVTAYIAYPPHVRRADPGNTAEMVKPIIDAFTDAAWWADDDSTHVIGPDYRMADHHSSPGWHEITIHTEGETTR